MALTKWPAACDLGTQYWPETRYSSKQASALCRGEDGAGLGLDPESLRWHPLLDGCPPSK